MACDRPTWWICVSNGKCIPSLVPDFAVGKSSGRLSLTTQNLKMNFNEEGFCGGGHELSLCWSGTCSYCAILQNIIITGKNGIKCTLKFKHVVETLPDLPVGLGKDVKVNEAGK